MSTPNVSRFPLILYKRILRLHYGLPSKEMRIMGDIYVKDEFRRHKNATREHALHFLKEWTVSFLLRFLNDEFKESF